MHSDAEVLAPLLPLLFINFICISSPVITSDILNIQNYEIDNTDYEHRYLSVLIKLWSDMISVSDPTNRGKRNHFLICISVFREQVIPAFVSLLEFRLNMGQTVLSHPSTWGRSENRSKRPSGSGPEKSSL